ncbi:hypothetical protein AWC38_SpisGene2639 [Stylophora pistillata]|uniref:Uncharacterized protein n=1 Tax=Stylophora pistillata TaxID=50429 RepID=A0A2B4STW7_STYPI|nr:hypothetical protein AWC38_SpisGene2639 [Stylophora pistillata]
MSSVEFPSTRMPSQTDDGTENAVVEAIRPFLRSAHGTPLAFVHISLADQHQINALKHIGLNLLKMDLDGG